MDLQHRGEFGHRVLRERLGDKDARVVDERVDTTKPLDPGADRPFGRRPVGDIAGNSDDRIILRRFDRSRSCDHAIAALAIGADEGRADALRRAGDDRHFSLDIHDSFPFSRISTSRQVRAMASKGARRAA